MSASEPSPDPGFRAYLGGLSSWFLAQGIGMVMVQWLVSDVLHRPADDLGLVQMCAMGPSLLFMLYGGAVADRGDARRQLIVCHALAAVPPVALAVLVVMGELSFLAMIAYGAVAGTIAAFAIPARDGLLPRVTRLPMPRAVAIATGMQFLTQLLGIAAAMAADRTGAAPLLVVQALAVGLGAIAIVRLHPQAAARPPSDAGSGLVDGVRVAMREPRIWPVIALIFAIGLFYVAPFVVVLPIAVRDVYGGGSARLALLNLMFWAGTIAASFAIARFGTRLVHRGRAMVLALAMGFVVLALMALLPPFPVVLALIFIWGTGAGVTMTQGRTIVQMAAPASHRGRVLALFQLGFMGGAPIGAPIVGTIASGHGLTAAMLVAVVGMICVIAIVLATSRIWRERSL
ncbi:MAG: MFS transporter [Alphaproteobacteria bacterium]|nr:MFS transporter [Alphaproteobacteria bacterium]MCW5739327.1 MFS transporter [Alphaproteobacteria bacterium]